MKKDSIGFNIESKSPIMQNKWIKKQKKNTGFGYVVKEIIQSVNMRRAEGMTHSDFFVFTEKQVIGFSLQRG